MRCRDCHHFLRCARVLERFFVFSEFGFFSWRRPHASAADLAPAPTLSSFCPSKQKDASHEFGTDWTWEIRATSNLCTSQRKSASDMQLASGRVLSLSLALRSFLAFECFFLAACLRLTRRNEITSKWGRHNFLVHGVRAFESLEHFCSRNLRFCGRFGLFTTFCRLTCKVRICNQLTISGLYRSTEAGSQLSCLTSVAECVQRAFHLQAPRCKLKAGRFFEEIVPESPLPPSLAAWWRWRALSRRLTDKIWVRHSCTLCGNSQWCFNLNSSLHPFQIFAAVSECGDWEGGRSKIYHKSPCG